MKRYMAGLISGIILSVGLMALMGSAQVEDDSLKTMMTRLDEYLKGELSKKYKSGRYQLQSFQIERTHWHYMLDTATGELYRLDPSRTPGNAQWILTAEAHFKN